LATLRRGEGRARIFRWEFLREKQRKRRGALCRGTRFHEIGEPILCRYCSCEGDLFLRAGVQGPESFYKRKQRSQRGSRKGAKPRRSLRERFVRRNGPTGRQPSLNSQLRFESPRNTLRTRKGMRQNSGKRAKHFDHGLYRSTRMAERFFPMHFCRRALRQQRSDGKTNQTRGVRPRITQNMRMAESFILTEGRRESRGSEGKQMRTKRTQGTRPRITRNKRIR
jgi:hypothetical protein